jgi:hypothetical protein
LNNAFDVITFGTWSVAKKAEAMDKLFHLSIIATLERGGFRHTLLIEKNEVIDIGPVKKASADMNLPESPYTQSSSNTRRVYETWRG